MGIMFNFEYLLYALLLIGVILINITPISRLISKQRSKARLRNISSEGSEVPKGNLHTHIAMLLKATFNIRNKDSAFYFEIGSIIFSGIIMILLNKVLPSNMAVLIGCLALPLPYVILRLMLEELRHKGSFEGDMLISEILNQYKLNYYKMEEALEKAADNLEDAPISQNILYKISSEIKLRKNDAELRQILNEFDYRYKTNWSSILSNNIYFAIADGVVVTDALHDLIGSIAKARKILEHSKRENSEALNMLKYLAPATYILSIVAAVKFFNFTVEKFFSYQFQTETGVQFFIYFVIAYVASISLALFFQRRKMDL